MERKISFKQITPTKTNLIALQKSFESTYKGQMFLEFKRQLLINQIKDYYETYENNHIEFLKIFKIALNKLNENYIHMGKKNLVIISKISKIQFNPLIDIKFLKRYGLKLPQFDYNFNQDKKLPAFAFDNTSHHLDDLVNDILNELIIKLLKFAFQIM